MEGKRQLDLHDPESEEIAMYDVSDLFDLSSELSPNMSESNDPNVPLTNRRRSDSRNAVRNWLDRSVLEKGQASDETIKASKKRVRTYYKHQNRLVEAFFNLDSLETETPPDEAKAEAEGRRVKIAVYGSFAVNICLFAIKIYAAIASGSLAVIASALVLQTWVKLILI